MFSIAPHISIIYINKTLSAIRVCKICYITKLSDQEIQRYQHRKGEIGKIICLMCYAWNMCRRPIRNKDLQSNWICILSKYLRQVMKTWYLQYFIKPFMIDSICLFRGFDRYSSIISLPRTNIGGGGGVTYPWQIYHI